jgi:hypothetical protein
MLQPWMIPADLAPGDARSLERDWSGLELHRVESAEDPLFDEAFGTLWAEFGASGEVEQAAVLARRMRWNGHAMIKGCALRYRMMLLKANGKIAGIRDHTAIVRDDRDGVVVHLSHNLIMPEWRRTGLAGWMRALPILTARHCLAAQGRPTDGPITLVGEMEHPDPNNLASLVRLKAYEKAGYRKIDPRRVNYLQPDFHSPEEIDDQGGPRPIPLSLIVRRVGCEAETEISGREVRDLAESLYRMYRAGFREKDMTPLFASLETYPAPETCIELLPPSADIRPA